MISRFAKSVFVISATAPALVTFSAARYGTGEWKPWGVSSAIIAPLLCLLAWLLIKEFRRTLDKFSVEIIELKTADQEIVGFVVIYLFPLLTIGPLSISAAAALVVAALFLWILVTTHAYNFNPVLSAMGYHFYEVKSHDMVTYVLLSKRHLRTVPGFICTVQLTEYLLLDLGEKAQ